MSTFRWSRQLFCGFVITMAVVVMSPIAHARTGDDRPNVVYILADDLGYGSINSYGADRDLVKTPHLNRLAETGLQFTNAVTASSVCSPTRYGFLMGRHPWRTRMKAGVLGVNSPLLPNPERPSIASWLDGLGYRSAAIGKWHLGYGDKRRRSPKAWTGTLDPGPLELGFDYHFGVPQNHGDYTGIYVQNHRIWKLDSDEVHPYSRSFYGKRYMGFDAPQRVNKNVMSRLTDRAVSWLDRQKEGKPFFLYFASVAVHVPITPSDRMRGESGAGPYGDFIQDLDRSVGRILQKLDEMGVADDTLVIVTSDNGGEIPGMKQRPEKQAVRAGLSLNGNLRGDKHTIWEGGVRVPFIARWPGVIPAGKTTDAPISLNDSFATVTDLIEGEPISADQGSPDGFSFANVLRGQEPGGIGHPTVVSNAAGTRALRWEDWKYIEGTFPDTVNERRQRHFRRSGQAGKQLYHLGLDRSEEHNIVKQFPELASMFQKMLDAIRHHQSTRKAVSDAEISADLRKRIKRIPRTKVKQALTAAGPVDDQWAWDQIEITNHSPRKSGQKFALEHLFNGGSFDGARQKGFRNDRGQGIMIFRDGTGGAGTNDFIEWRVNDGPVTLNRIYVSAKHDGKSPYHRSIGHIQLIADTDGQSGFDPAQDRVLIDDDITVPYKNEEKNSGWGNELDIVYELDKPVTAQSFRVVFTRSTDWAPRLLELSGLR